MLIVERWAGSIVTLVGGRLLCFQLQDPLMVPAFGDEHEVFEMPWLWSLFSSSLLVLWASWSSLIGSLGYFPVLPRDPPGHRSRCRKLQNSDEKIVAGQ